MKYFLKLNLFQIIIIIAHQNTSIKNLSTTFLSIKCYENDFDFIFIHFNYKLSYIDKGAVLINVGRGSIIQDKDLIDALEKGWLKAAILDVFNTEPLPIDNPLWTTPGVSKLRS